MKHCYIDLHLHLDGSLSVTSAKELAVLQDLPIPDNDAALRQKLQAGEDCRDLNEFLEKFGFPCALLQTPEALRMATKNLLTELQADGVIYAEVRFAPQLHTQKGMTQQQAVEAVLHGVEDAPIPAGVILCCMRGDNNHSANMETVRVAEALCGKGVCALDLAGAEALYPTEDFADLFSAAGNAGVPFTIHAGEADGAQSVAAALDFGACRIGHGVRSLEDDEVVQRLAQQKIPVELCPTSNLITGIYPDMEHYPLRRLMESGVPVTVNTDDMAVCGTDIKNEYRKLIETFHLTTPEVRQLLHNAVDASFADDAVKAMCREKIESAWKE